MWRAGCRRKRRCSMKRGRSNAEAALRARAKLISVERRLANLTPVAAKPASLTYGRDGRWA